MSTNRNTTLNGATVFIISYEYESLPLVRQSHRGLVYIYLYMDRANVGLCMNVGAQIQ